MIEFCLCLRLHALVHSVYRMAAADSVLPSENIAVIPHPIAVPEPSMSVLEILITEVYHKIIFKFL